MSNDEPAFPLNEMMQSDPSNIAAQHFGMTLRDYFAAHAPIPSVHTNMEAQVAYRWRYAAEMIRQRTYTQPPA